jgi:hypothetical protein
MRTEWLRRKATSVSWAVVKGVLTIFVFAFALWLSVKLLSSPTASGTLSIKALTGSLTFQPLCNEPVTWDLPAGRVGRRSVGRGEAGYETPPRPVTLALAAGSRTRVISPRPGVLQVSVENLDQRSQPHCQSTASAPYRLILNGEPEDPDPIGFNYESTTAEDAAPLALNLPVSGRVTLGQAVSEGAGWSARPAAILLSGSILRRVKPWWSTDEAMTVGEPESLDEGSIFDSHACAPEKGSSFTAPECSAEQLTPAVGFFRTLKDGGLQVQLYARGPASVQNYRGPNRRIEVPLSTALWQSDTVKVLGVFFLLVYACFDRALGVCKFTYRLLGLIAKTPLEFVRDRLKKLRYAVAVDHTGVNASETAEPSDAAEASLNIDRVEQTSRTNASV